MRTNTIHKRMTTKKNLEICFRIRFRNGKANKFPQIFFRICFHNDHVGHAQATTAGHAYKIHQNPGDFLSLSLSYCNREKIERKSKSRDFYLFSLVIVSVRMVGDAPEQFKSRYV